MKHRNLLKTMLLLCALVAGTSMSWATDVVAYTLTPTSGSNNSYTGNCDIEISGITWNLVGNSQQIPWRIGGKSLSNVDRELYSKTAITDDVTKIIVTHGGASSITVNSMTVIVSKNSDFSSPVSTLTPSFVADDDITITRPDGKNWSNCYFKFVYNVSVSGSSNKYLVFKEAKFYKEQIAITSISLPSTETVGVGGTVTLTPTVTPANYTETVDWESDDEGVATVSSTGVVTGVAAGTAHIKAKAHDNPSTIYGECTVTVTAPIAVNGVTLKSSTTIEVGKTETLVPTISPVDATNKNVVWFTDDDSKVSVDDDGVITGLAVTDTPVVITVVTEDGGKEAECEVTVIPKNTDVNLTSPISITTWPTLSYGDAAEYEAGGVCFTATQCMNNAGLQFKKSEGILASPLIKSTYGYTVIVTTNTTGTGTLTLQIGSETPVSISSGSSTTYSATTSNTSVAFTLTNSSSKACNIASLSIVPYVPVTVTSDGYATLASSFALDFTDAATYAYIAKADGRTGVTFERIKKVPANTGVLLYKDGGATENIPVLDGEADATTGNVFVPGTGAAVASVSGDLHNYILNKPTAKPIGFYKAAGQTVAANKAYIQIDYSVVAGIKEFITLPGMEDDATSIQNSKFEIQNEEAPIYNLAGQRISKMQKGINIVNGKKIMVK